ncbi:hypothetical protein HPB49_010240 [Dermacentor silvarum]|uniref:Uncharacterized protein n=1 Tax=Dermacentor silvarum TaxID=543639 RepID=A0ACB8D4L7_DERSI|nr:hypothetical protein HPB49_010240 [Dermacentor silvarum]
MEESLTSKLGSMIQTAMDQILIKVMTAVPTMISKHIMAAPASSAAVIALQEPGLGAALPNYMTFQQDAASCLLVHKAYTANIVDLDLQLEYSYVMVTILPLRRRDSPLHVLNVYCSPKLKQGYTAWSQHLLKHLRSQETQIQLSEAVTDVDNHLLHLWEARRSLVRRWRRQKHNTKLKARISELTQRTAEYAAQLADSNWADRCNTAARQMSSRNTWRLFRTFIAPTQTRTETQKHLHRAVHAFPGNMTQLAQKLRDQYLCTAQDSRGSAYSYEGKEHTELGQPFQLHDLRAALAKMK